MYKSDKIILDKILLVCFLETAMRAVNIQEMLKTDEVCDLLQFLCEDRHMSYF